MRLSLTLCVTMTVTMLLTMTMVSARRSDQDFEFEDDGDGGDMAAEVSDNSLDDEIATPKGGHRPRRYIYDPHNSLCRALRCKKRDLCLLRDPYTALCANKRDILRKGDVIVSGGDGPGGGGADEADDVFYESGAHDLPGPELDPAPDRCVGCGGGGGGGVQGGGGDGGGGGFLCGSDNRTYSSLCRLDLHNCVRRPSPPVILACRGFCPCRARSRGRSPRPRPHPRPRPRAHPRPRPRGHHRRQPDPAHNEVSPRRRVPPGASGCALDEMANRLLDWFSVLMEEAKETALSSSSRAGFPHDCKPEVRWMFAHLDTDGDGLLSSAELYPLRHDSRERCLRPFLSSCVGSGSGSGSGANGDVTRSEWCSCLARAARPCTALARAHTEDVSHGGYIPACDVQGYYRPRQCHSALGVCWCVDAHGTELPGSRTRGAPDCDRLTSLSPAAPADDEDDGGAGSGDDQPRY